MLTPSAATSSEQNKAESVAMCVYMHSNRSQACYHTIHEPNLTTNHGNLCSSGCKTDKKANKPKPTLPPAGKRTKETTTSAVATAGSYGHNQVTVFPAIGLGGMSMGSGTGIGGGVGVGVGMGGW
jgi:hypothetical protein